MLTSQGQYNTIFPVYLSGMDHLCVFYRPVGSDFVRASEVAEINNNISEFIDMAERLKSCKCLPMAQLPDVGLMCAGKKSLFCLLNVVCEMISIQKLIK